MSNLIVFEALAVFAIWMQRKKRWAAFIKAATGEYVVQGSAKAGSIAALNQSPNGTVTPSGSGTIQGINGLNLNPNSIGSGVTNSIVTPNTGKQVV